MGLILCAVSIKSTPSKVNKGDKRQSGLLAELSEHFSAAGIERKIIQPLFLTAAGVGVNWCVETSSSVHWLLQQLNSHGSPTFMYCIIIKNDTYVVMKVLVVHKISSS